MSLSDGLVGYWSPWLGSSGYRLLDRTRYANHGTLTNMDAGTDWVGATIQGKSGCVLDFDGTDDRIETGAVTRSLTISLAVWVKLDYANSDNFARLVEHGLNQSVTVCLNKPNQANKLTLQIGDANTAATWTANVTSNWEHFGVSILHSTGVNTISLYRNGVLDTTASKTITPSGSYKWFLGGSDPSVTSVASFAGQIAELNVWDRSLLAAEFRELCRLGAGWYQPYKKRGYGYAAAVAGFKAYWHRRQSQIIGGGLR